MISQVNRIKKKGVHVFCIVLVLDLFPRRNAAILFLLHGSLFLQLQPTVKLGRLT